MNEFVKRAFEHGRLALLLGAGASAGSTTSTSTPIPMGEQLARILANEAGFEYSGESLATVYTAARRQLGDQLTRIFEREFKHCKPSHEYLSLAKFPWSRIYTLNIDDALDQALRQHSKQRISVLGRCDRVVDQDQFFDRLELIKLNGEITRPNEGFIFSAQEYGKASANPPLWYEELARDYFKYLFVFIGTKLNEPLFYHQIERFRAISNSREQRGLVITPSATAIEKASLQELNLEHIDASLTSFVSWLESTFPDAPTPLDIAMTSKPELRVMLQEVKEEERHRYATVFDRVLLVERASLDSTKDRNAENGKIRDFYYGFKPTWRDILDGVPAELEATTECHRAIDGDLKLKRNLLVVAGPAGSGKSTLLKQVAIRVSDRREVPVYYIEEPVDKLQEIVLAFEKANMSRYCLFLERLDPLSEDLQRLLKAGMIQKGLIIGAESLSIWGSRVSAKLGEFATNIVTLSQITKKDATTILTKIERYGPWTRLAKLSPEKRIEELIERARRQLLIGLLETTLGDGFERIIEKDYNRLEDNDQRLFLVIVGLATIHRSVLHDSYLLRAMQHVGIRKSPADIARAMSGIIHQHDSGGYTVRHPVYARHLFEQVIDSQNVVRGVRALLSAFTVYEAPVLRYIKKNEATLFKGIINHRFLKTVLHEDKDLIVGTYEMFEKFFEKDGLFWLQYGLALRDFNLNEEALSKLRTAYEAYPMAHTEHALAQQEIIMGIHAPSRTLAYDYLEKARDRLERLDRVIESDDIYPIVTLAEGHTHIVLKFDGINEAKQVGKRYIETLKIKQRKYVGDQRLKQAHDRLFTFIATGNWSEEGE